MTVPTTTKPPGTASGPDAVALTDPAVDRLVEAWGSWGPTMTRNARRVAFVSDRFGVPEVFVQDVVVDGPPPEPTRVAVSADPVVRVSWSADSEWLAVALATDGGVRQQIWVVRPDGRDARRIAGSRHQHAELGPWSRSGHRVVVTLPSTEADRPARSYLVDPEDGTRHDLATGELIHVLDLSVEERLVVLRDGRRGHEFVVVVDRLTDDDHPLLVEPWAGSAEAALIRPAPEGESSPLVAYLSTEAGLPRRQLVAMPIGPHGWRGSATVLAGRDDAELEALDADDAGRLLLLVWNAWGRSELELLDTASGERHVVDGLPGAVVTHPVLSRDGRSVVATVEGPTHPRELWRLDTVDRTWTRVTGVPAPPGDDERGTPLVEPSLERFTARDGLALSGWLYEAPHGTGAAVVWLHGGPESQERPTFSAHHQALVAAGITVFAPNIRGSSGFGGDFVHADDRERRWAALDDVVDSAGFLVDTGRASADRVAVAGRSYGGYATLASLAFSPDVFAAGIDVCGMSSFDTFYRDTEPWIASAAASKYGHPVDDAELLAALSPLGRVDDLVAPVLVVHGELDTNVPIGEARQVVAALRERGRDVTYLELGGEGHEYRRLDSQKRLVGETVAFARRVLLDPHSDRQPAPGFATDM